ncbi:MAG TPA: DUF962 domain-containing protein [Bacteroidia bacterium]|nr:DUF962 domain-containing protein [Bacteroidia bacterium]
MKSFIKEVNSFYPEYLQAHSDKGNRTLHFIGATSFFVFLALAFITGQWWYAPIAIMVGYVLPGVGHHYLERNESFRATKPALCVACAFRLYVRMLTFGLIR